MFSSDLLKKTSIFFNFNNYQFFSIYFRSLHVINEQESINNSRKK